MNERPRMTKAFTVVELLVVILIIALLIAILLPALARAREAARTVACSNNVRNLGLGIFQYAERYGGQMPSAFYNLFHYLAPYLGDRSVYWDTAKMSPSDVWRCGSDQFLGPGCFLDDEVNQCSYAANADRTGTDALDPDSWAGWSVEIEGNHYGASFSPFAVKYYGCDPDEQAAVRIASVATDTVLMAESWRDRQVNALYLVTARVEAEGGRMYGLYDDGSVQCSRDSLLLVAYESGENITIDAATGDITDAGPFSFLRDVADLLGDPNRPYSLEDAYHLGRINVLYADGHVDPVRCKMFASGPGGGPWGGCLKIADIPYWNKNED